MSVPTEDLRTSNRTTIESDSKDDGGSDELEPSIHAKKMTKLIMEWANTGAPTKSNAEINHLICDYVCHPDFKPEDLQNFDAG